MNANLVIPLNAIPDGKPLAPFLELLLGKITTRL